MYFFFFTTKCKDCSKCTNFVCACVEREREKERERDLIPLLGLGSTRSGKGTDAGEESAKLAALCPLVKEEKEKLETTLAST